ncbi:MAG: hypothetical protein K9M75_03760 [Phycisphaerae bacterium]|nr:hypothetical protein [Phycisphaerae bacterium]
MKRYLVFIVGLSFCIAAGVNAGDNALQAVDKSDITAAPETNSNKNYSTIDNAIKFITSDTAANEPNEPNVPGQARNPEPVADVAVPIPKKLPGVVSISVFPAIELPEFKYRLLPLDAERTDGDAARFYVQAIDALPAGFSQSTVNGLLNAPMDKFNGDTAASIVNSSAKSMELIRQGGLARKCQWSKQTADKKAFSLLKGLNSLTSVIALKARLDTSTGEYKTAVETVRDGLAMSRHIANTPSSIQAMAAVNTASVMLKNVQELIKSPQAPSLYRSLSDLPKPLVNLNLPVAAITEVKRMRDKFGEFREFSYEELDYNETSYGFGPGPDMISNDNSHKKPVEDSPYSRKDMILQMNKLDRLVAALKCLEGIRYYAAIHGGKLPASLADISDLSLPLDPVTQRPFRYQLGTGKALLGSPVTDKQADRESTVYFEISTKTRSASAGIKANK